MKLWQNCKLLLILGLLGGCVSYTPPSNYAYKEIITPEFNLASWQKLQEQNAPITFYIEGDGHAFNSSGKISQDPTPRQTTFREIAFRDQDKNIVYLARPCQYIKSPQCSKKYWSTGRFAPEVIKAEAEAIKQILKQNHSSKAILVGYSGGAMVAGLVAVKNPDIEIDKLITIAGLLEHKKWAEYHKVPPLKSSLDLGDYQKEYARFPQIHFVGDQDEVIIKELIPVGKDKIIIIKGADHNNGWDKLNLQPYK